VSATTQVAVLASLRRDGRDGPASSRRVAGASDRPLVRVVAFAALGFYGVLRWSTLLSPPATWRLLGLLALAVALAGSGPLLRSDGVAATLGGRLPPAVLGAPLAVLAVLAAFPLAGVPLAWTVHLRIAVTADGIGEGLSALPGVLVPYSGINGWVRTVNLLGAAILLLDGGLLLAFAPTALGDVRRAAAALPLIALAVVPAALVRPSVPYVHGLILFGLLAFFMWGERVPAGRRGSVLLACGASGAAAMILAPALDRHTPWLNYQAFTRGLSPAHIDSFDWTQRYGPLNWPRTGNVVLEVKASPGVWGGEYWKAENLNSFDGVGWVSGDMGGDSLQGIKPRTLSEFSQNLQVTVRGMNSVNVIAAGDAPAQPTHLAQAVLPGSSAGTWVTASTLGPGDSYTVQVYAPHPTPPQLAAAGTAYPAGLKQSYLLLTMPQLTPGVGVQPQQVLFPAFGSHGPVEDMTDPLNYPGAAAIQSSPYSGVYALARRLERGARTPYAYATKVIRYLSGFTYDEYPPLTTFPLQTFLMSSQVGYCQQFAGAMALLLRMGGVPARVATGFTTGSYDSATKQWLVSDIDAHAWVEAWFPHYGWVTFDPTPPAAPARGGRGPIESLSSLGQTGAPEHAVRKTETPAVSPSVRAGAHHGGSVPVPLLVGLGVAALALLGGFIAWRRIGPPDADALLAELERALVRSGRPIADGVTLAALERRFRTSPEAAAYVRVLRLSRYGGKAELPSLRHRRALRGQLRAGLGAGGALRALWALPPRPKRFFSGAGRRDPALN
jgi:protein-glutamine gamma-glutamyltransferase